ncbi:Retrovirus-related Pol polyprotein from transposon TNT 1-94 [Cucumis melo var. makuwa]|uniref:Retrovirus-related Pol polyprotein from transposon TNT 1-94 n=1 Tax=Cucumis melo var. makuwa TaxID=1194695 RepID=A0A5A7TEE8_CUCMM|nr:Retrovirus-related Pol polyprotein from transposon TNT 1-94 [Cucumis melo var. makuwa]TYK24396.1 Retrovirus-related Pol polyprotein from transposon TNT 1-94 [Cucumis melo var. makuwa]
MQNAWIMDSGCTYHMTSNRDFLTDFQKNDEGKALLGENSIGDVKGTGELDRSDYAHKSKNGVLKVTKGSLVKLRGALRNGLYVLEGTIVSGNAATTLEQ